MKAGDRGVDTSGYALDPAQLVKDGGKFRIRYSAGVGNSQPATQWKLCGPGEVKAAIAAGLDFIANSEWYESRITEGAAAGHADGLADLVFWKARGLAQGASIYVSWDAQPVPAKWAAVDSYLAAYELALAGYYHVDCYAGTPYLKHALAKGLIRYGWRPNAGAWSGDGIPYQPAVNADLIALAMTRTPAHIVQTGNYWYGKQADENVIVRTPVGSHLDALDRPKPPPPPAPASSTLLEDIMALDRNSADYKALVADVAHAVWASPITLETDPTGKPTETASAATTLRWADRFAKLAADPKALAAALSAALPASVLTQADIEAAVSHALNTATIDIKAG